MFGLERRPVTLIVTQVTSCVFSPFAGTHFVAGMSQVTSYSLALLKLMDERYESTRQPPLGIARRVGAESSTFDMPAHKILIALITHAQSPETIAKELLIEIGKCGNGLVEALGCFADLISYLLDVF